MILSLYFLGMVLISSLLGFIDQAFLYGFRITLWIGAALTALAITVLLKYFTVAQSHPHSQTQSQVLPGAL